MPLVGTCANASARAYGFTSAGAPEVLGGMVLITPTSIVSTGTGNSSSIGGNGSVTFSSCVTLSLNGVFTADYNNYMIVMQHQQATTSDSVYARLRASGTDSTATTDYNDQYLTASGTNVSGLRISNAGKWFLNNSWTTMRGGFTSLIYGPYLAQPTAIRTVTVDSNSNAEVNDTASTHELSTSYDGITFSVAAGTFAGFVSVYGLVGA